jgi:hypothetical protein
MHLNDWYSDEMKRVRQFCSWWREQHMKDPDAFPVEMDSDEWLWQYSIWEE